MPQVMSLATEILNRAAMITLKSSSHDEIHNLDAKNTPNSLQIQIEKT